MTLRAPQPLAEQHRLESFDCGKPALDDWLLRHARQAQGSGSAKTFVVAEDDGRVAGYFSLTVGQVEPLEAPERIRKGMGRYPLPVVILARLAVSKHDQGRGIGFGLLQDAIRRTSLMAEQAGIRAILTHPIDEEAARFYARFGFTGSPLREQQLLLLLKDARRWVRLTRAIGPFQVVLDEAVRDDIDRQQKVRPSHLAQRERVRRIASSSARMPQPAQMPSSSRMRSITALVTMPPRCGSARMPSRARRSALGPGTGIGPGLDGSVPPATRLWRAKRLMTAPIDDRSRRASSLAARNTSSAMSSVVRMAHDARTSRFNRHSMHPPRRRDGRRGASGRIAKPRRKADAGSVVRHRARPTPGHEAGAVVGERGRVVVG